MRLELATSMDYRNGRITSVAYRVNDGSIEFFESCESEQLTLVSLLTIILQKCQVSEALTILSRPNTLTKQFEDGNFAKWVREKFSGKSPMYRVEWKLLKDLFDVRGIEQPIIGRNTDKAQKELSKAAKQKLPGRQKTFSDVRRPGEPDENPWAKHDETLEEYLARKHSKD